MFSSMTNFVDIIPNISESKIIVPTCIVFFFFKREDLEPHLGYSIRKKAKKIAI